MEYLSPINGNSDLIKCDNCGLNNKPRANCIKCGHPLGGKAPEPELQRKYQPEPKRNHESEPSPDPNPAPKKWPESNQGEASYGFAMDKRKIIFSTIIGIVMVAVGSILGGVIGQILYVIGFILFMFGAQYLYIHLVRKK